MVIKSVNKQFKIESGIPQAVMFMTGAKVGFYRGDIKHLSDDIKELRPTVIPVVPRLMNRIYDKVFSLLVFSITFHTIRYFFISKGDV